MNDQSGVGCFWLMVAIAAIAGAVAGAVFKFLP
jgi:hypothetical protein